MKIYIAHSKEINYIDDLYIPLKNHNHNNHELILPHEHSNTNYNTRNFYKSLDVLIAEVSKPAVGLGIELGWAFDDNVPIYCLYKKGSKYSSSIKCITSNIYEYSNTNELIQLFDQIISKIQK